jgi:hypothetical protein
MMQIVLAAVEETDLCLVSEAGGMLQRAEHRALSYDEIN